MHHKEFYFSSDPKVEPGWIFNEQERNFPSSNSALFTETNVDVSIDLLSYHSLYKIVDKGDYIWKKDFKESNCKGNFVFKIGHKYQKEIAESEHVAENMVRQVNYEEFLWFLVCTNDESEETKIEVKNFVTNSTKSEMEISPKVLNNFRSCVIYKSNGKSQTYKVFIHGLKELIRLSSDTRKEKNMNLTKFVIVQDIYLTPNTSNAFEADKRENCIKSPIDEISVENSNSLLTTENVLNESGKENPQGQLFNSSVRNSSILMKMENISNNQGEEKPQSQLIGSFENSSNLIPSDLNENWNEKRQNQIKSQAGNSCILTPTETYLYEIGKEKSQCQFKHSLEDFCSQFPTKSAVTENWNEKSLNQLESQKQNLNTPISSEAFSNEIGAEKSQCLLKGPVVNSNILAVTKTDLNKKGKEESPSQLKNSTQNLISLFSTESNLNEKGKEKPQSQLEWLENLNILLLRENDLNKKGKEEHPSHFIHSKKSSKSLVFMDNDLKKNCKENPPSQLEYFRGNSISRTTSESVLNVNGKEIPQNQHQETSLSKCCSSDLIDLNSNLSITHNQHTQQLAKYERSLPLEPEVACPSNNCGTNNFVNLHKVENVLEDDQVKDEYAILSDTVYHCEMEPTIVDKSLDPSDDIMIVGSCTPSATMSQTVELGNCCTNAICSEKTNGVTMCAPNTCNEKTSEMPINAPNKEDFSTTVPLSNGVIIPGKITETSSYKHICYGNKNTQRKAKVILLIGATGSGKTTLVNFIANYYFGAQKADEDKIFIDCAKGKTRKITMYSFYPADELKLPVTIIDTPGLNDSTGAEINDHVDALKSFVVSSCSLGLQVCAIGFVCQAHLVRLTSSEKLVMDHVKSLFGSGIENHLITFVTFSDNQTTPPVIEAMNAYDIETKLFVKFDNSFLNGAEQVDDLDRIYWKIGFKSWKKSLKFLQQMEPLSQNAIDAVSKEVFNRSIVQKRVDSLTSEIRKYFTFVESKYIPKDISTDANKKQRQVIWNHLNVVYCFQSGKFDRKERLLFAVCEEQMKKGKSFHPNQVLFLLLDSQSSFRNSFLAVLNSMIIMIYSLFKISQNLNKAHLQKSSLVLYCHVCEKHCFFKRKAARKFNEFSSDVLFKCSCMCAAGVHGQAKEEHQGPQSISFTDTFGTEILHSLNKIIEDFPLPGYKWSIEKIYEFLLCEEAQLSKIDFQNVKNSIIWINFHLNFLSL